MADVRRFEFSEGTSNKFWEVFQDGKSVTVRFGRIGTDGQTQVKAHASEAEALKVLEKLIKEKTGKGYVEAGAPKKAAAKSEEKPKAAKSDDKPKAAKSDDKPKKKGALDPGWVAAGNGYALSLTGGKLAAQKDGKPLASVPKPLKEGELAERLLAAQEFLEAHARECIATVESWMLRSLSTPRKVLAAVFRDDDWRKALENAVVMPVDANGKADHEALGFFKGVDAKKGLGVVNLDGETKWIDAPSIWLPHPVVLGDSLDDLRSLAGELGLSQGIAQLFREVYTKKKDLSPQLASIDEFENGEFEQLNHAFGVAKKNGYRVTGGSAVARIWEGGRVYEARYYLGDGDPFYETSTGDLTWVDDKQRPLNVADVPPIAFSEGMRMASSIYAKRKVEKNEEEA